MPPPNLPGLQPWPAAAHLQFAAAGLLWGTLLVLSAKAAAEARLWRELDRDDALGLAAALALGLGMRLWAEPFPSDIRPATDMGFLVGPAHHWAAGYSVLLHALFAVFTPRLETACGANAALGTLTVPALYLFVRVCFRDRLAALAAAFALACLPVHARFSASDSAHILAALSLVLSGACAVAWARKPGWRLLALCAGWLAMAANARPETGGFALAAAGLAVAAGARRISGAASWLSLSAAAGLCLYPAACVLKLEMGSAVPHPLNAFLPGGPWFANPDAPWLMQGASVVGAAVLLGGRETRRLGCAWLAALFVAAVPSLSYAGPAQDTNYRYFLPALALLCGLAGTGLAALARTFLPPSGRAGRAATLALPLLVVVGSLPHAGILRRAWTHQLEFFFARAHLAGIPDGCAIVTPAPYRSDSGLEFSRFLSREAGRTHLWTDAEAFLKGPPPSCAVWYQAAACFAAHRSPRGEAMAGPFDGRPECRAMKKVFSVPLAETLLPARPYVNEDYRRDPIPVGFYRAAQAAPGKGGPSSSDKRRTP